MSAQQASAGMKESWFLDYSISWPRTIRIFLFWTICYWVIVGMGLLAMRSRHHSGPEFLAAAFFVALVVPTLSRIVVRPEDISLAHLLLSKSRKGMSLLADLGATPVSPAELVRESVHGLRQFQRISLICVAINLAVCLAPLVLFFEWFRGSDIGIASFWRRAPDLLDPIIGFKPRKLMLTLVGIGFFASFMFVGLRASPYQTLRRRLYGKSRPSTRIAGLLLFFFLPSSSSPGLFPYGGFIAFCIPCLLILALMAAWEKETNLEMAEQAFGRLLQYHRG